MKQKFSCLLLFASCLLLILSFSACGGDDDSSGVPGLNLTPYVITGSGTSFTAKHNGSTVETANQPIAIVIGYIKSVAAGADCHIQLGNGTDPLDITSGSIEFNDTGWGTITLSGKATSSSEISVNNSNTVHSIADITHNSSGHAFRIDNGTLSIYSGTFTSTGLAIGNYGGGTLTIYSGTFTGAHSDGTIFNGGTATIYSGTITGSPAIYNIASQASFRARNSVTINGSIVGDITRF